MALSQFHSNVIYFSGVVAKNWNWWWRLGRHSDLGCSSNKRGLLLLPQKSSMGEIFCSWRYSRAFSWRRWCDMPRRSLHLRRNECPWSVKQRHLFTLIRRFRAILYRGVPTSWGRGFAAKTQARIQWVVIWRQALLFWRRFFSQTPQGRWRLLSKRVNWSWWVQRQSACPVWPRFQQMDGSEHDWFMPKSPTGLWNCGPRQQRCSSCRLGWKWPVPAKYEGPRVDQIQRLGQTPSFINSHFR